MINISRAQLYGILAVIVVGVAFAAPNLFQRDTVDGWPSWAPQSQFNLGLDLQGGVHLLLEADLSDVTERRMRNVRRLLRDGLRGHENRIRPRQLRVREREVRFRIAEPDNIPIAEQIARRVIREVDTNQGILSAAAPNYELEETGDGIFVIRMTDAGLATLRDQILQQSIEVLRDRVDPTGTLEPNIQRQGDTRIVLQVPGIDDSEPIKRAINTEARMTFHLMPDEQPTGPNDQPPAEAVMYPDSETTPDGQPLRYYFVSEDAAVEGDRLVDAQQTFQEGRPVISFRFDALGAQQFCRVTRANVGNPFAVVLDGKVITAPVIQSAICGGSGVITGNFTVQSAQELSMLLRAGALPAALTVVEERTVGPGLGQDSIDAGVIASIIGLILVVVFMVVTYGLFGAMATVALTVNLILLAAVLSLLQATLTLPGIAGIVLTIGMAVDANVLIFERIREEVRAGRTPLSAIDTGYRRALTTIIDSNLTTAIAAFLLFAFGSGPVKGFGVTLAFGLMTSMFSAIMVTRLMVVGWWRWRRPSALPI